ncbi:MAG: carbon-nitrogen hydrolase family protein [Isosphaeraceae bacterium]
MMNHSPSIRVAGVQMEPKLGELGENLSRIQSWLEAAASSGANLAVFPECALSGYGFGSREQGLDHAVAIDGPEVGRIADLTERTGCGCLFGFLERDGNRLFNACALIGQGKLLGSYRKVHLPFLGVDMFADPGDRPFAVHEYLGLRIGMHICYDGSFPEAARVMTLLGADLLALPTNWPTHSECAAEHMIPTRAMENTVYVMAVNRVGEESGFRFIGSSSIADPSGAIIARAGTDAEELFFAEIEPARARRKHLVRVPGRHEINRIGDRRPEFYGLLATPIVPGRTIAAGSREAGDRP